MLPLVRLNCRPESDAVLIDLNWYSRLSPDDSLEADRIAAEYAWDLFQKCVLRLTPAEAARVVDQTRIHFPS